MRISNICPRLVGCLVVATALTGAGSPAEQLAVAVHGLRTPMGTIVMCITDRAESFPDCRSDPAARQIAVPAASPQPILVPDLPSGRYAISVFHDDNANGRLDRILGRPAEAMGFSGNALPGGVPAFSRAVFTHPDSRTRHSIRLRHLD